MSMEIDRLSDISAHLEKDATDIQRSSKEQTSYKGDVAEARDKVDAYRAKEAKNKLYVYIAFSIFVTVALYVIGRRILWLFFGIRI